MLGASDLQRFRELLGEQALVVDLPDRVLRARLATILLRFGLTGVTQIESLLAEDWAASREILAEIRRPVDHI